MPEFKENEEPAAGAVVVPLVHNEGVLIKAKPYMLDSLSGW